MEFRIDKQMRVRDGGKRSALGEKRESVRKRISCVDHLHISPLERSYFQDHKQTNNRIKAALCLFD